MGKKIARKSVVKVSPRIVKQIQKKAPKSDSYDLRVNRKKDENPFMGLPDVTAEYLVKLAGGDVMRKTAKEPILMVVCEIAKQEVTKAVERMDRSRKTLQAADLMRTKKAVQ